MHPSRPLLRNSRRLVEQNEHRVASACCEPSCCCTPDRKSLSGCFGIATVVSMPRAAAHFSHRFSSVTELFSIFVTLTTPSRSLHTSHSIRLQPPVRPSRQVDHPRGAARDPPGPPVTCCASRRPSRSRDRARVVQRLRADAHRFCGRDSLSAHRRVRPTDPLRVLARPRCAAVHRLTVRWADGAYG